MKPSRSYVWSIVYAVGLAGIFAGERIIGAGAARAVLSALGFALIVASLIGRSLHVQKNTGERRAIEEWILGLTGVGLVAVLLYFIQSDAVSRWIKPLTQSSPKLAVVLAALWPALVATSLLPLFLAELSYASMTRSARVEAGRVRDAILSGLGLVGALVFAFAINYVARERDRKIDLAYFRTTRPGEATRKLVRSLDEPIEVALFFPPANEVRESVDEYLTDLAKESKFLEVQHYDQAVDVQKAKEMQVYANGAVVIAKKGKREQLAPGLELETARSTLQKFDQEFQKRLLQVVKSKRNIYFVTGHGERSEDTASPEKRWPIHRLKEVFRAQNYELKNLSAAEGLGVDVPKDAGAVVLVGPTQDLAREESASLLRYFQNRGRLMIALDFEANIALKDLLDPMGVRFVPMQLANDQAYLQYTNQLSDRAILATISYSSHPSVTTLSRVGRAPVVFFTSGYFQEISPRPKETSIDFPVRAHPQTWNDLNNNFQFDPPQEVRKGWELMAAITGKPGSPAEGQSRALLFADSDCLTDPLVAQFGNPYLAMDGMKWLLGEEAIAGEISTEEDVPIRHTRNQDKAWFYGTSFAIPGLVLLVGFFATRRRSRKDGESPRPEARS
jgi:hypothetical protein